MDNIDNILDGGFSPKTEKLLAELFEQTLQNKAMLQVALKNQAYLFNALDDDNNPDTNVLYNEFIDQSNKAYHEIRAEAISKML